MLFKPRARGGRDPAALAAAAESLPELEGLEFAARYEPAAPGLEVGGDWYEVVALRRRQRRGDDRRRRRPRDPRRLGHGPDAAGAARPVVADGYPPDGGGPAARRDDQGVRAARDGDRLSPSATTRATATAEYVRAGHPPALLRLPDGRIADLDGPGTAPLGILDGDEFREHAVAIPRGSLLLLYTDGLIERRGRRPGERARRACARRSPQAPGRPPAPASTGSPRNTGPSRSPTTWRCSRSRPTSPKH